ncbi:Uncharacterised protein [Escherichia coli]|uniref:DUF6602 domain-containing protein n=1 Tax=Escherichia coli TaxID=562 RepID=A0A377F4Z1_ECOLX|nr:Uncharacterised protein [Escherichia coli]
MLDTYLPKRYQAANAFVVDSLGNFSDQIDVVVFDRQYSPFIFKFNEQIIVPAESVYAVFEAKQSASADLVAYAQRKVASVRRLHRTSLPIPHAGGTYPAKPLIPIWEGYLLLKVTGVLHWGCRLTKPSMGIYLMDDLIWAVLHRMGIFTSNNIDSKFNFEHGNKPATAFLFRLIAQLQFSGTVPMIDIDAYGKWLAN